MVRQIGKCLEYVSGKSIQALRAKDKEPTIPLSLPLYAISRACMGLDYAHREKGIGNEALEIIHRDISPQNILVSYEGEGLERVARIHRLHRLSIVWI